jgi:flavin reductase (DIM6/NTAB) family NADH-FMN oxidoreductase RutF
MPQETKPKSACKDAMARLPSGRFLMTAAFGEARNGMIVTQVLKCADEPPTITVSVRKGHALSPLIRDSGCFALCEIAETDLMLPRLFQRPSDLQGEDPFLGHCLVPNTRELPVPKSAASWVVCDLLRHLDIEADHEIYIGRVILGEVLKVVDPRSKNGTPQAIKKTIASRRRLGTDGRLSPGIKADVPADQKKSEIAT